MEKKKRGRPRKYEITSTDEVSDVAAVESASQIVTKDFFDRLKKISRMSREDINEKIRLGEISQNEVFLSRYRLHENGSWEVAHKKHEEALEIAKQIDDKAKELCEMAHRLNDLQLEIYESVPMAEGLFVNSPICNGSVSKAIENFFAKKGLFFPVSSNPNDIPSVSEYIKQAENWIFRGEKIMGKISKTN